MATSQSVETREIRVFLSSTFKDMEAERHYLLTRVFPGLRALCAERDVGFTEIDLRWGVTEEESQNGRTVEICLEEIDRCRAHPPFFIGFLGERYGWVPQPADLAQYWATHNDSPYAHTIEKALAQGISVTELELRHGFLDPDQHVPPDHARVFLRDRSLTETLYTAAQSRVRTDFYDAGDGKLGHLKEVLRQHQCVGLDGYTTVEAFGAAVEAFLRQAIEAIAPEATPDPAARRDRAQALYAASRRKTYVPLPEIRAAVLAAVTRAWGEDTPTRRVTICAPSGFGKSALCADLAAWLPEQPQTPWVHSHFLGADGDRSLAGWRDRVFAALEATKSLQTPVPTLEAARWEALSVAVWETRRTLQRPLVLILDALDQGNTEDLPALAALKLPAQVALVVSTTQTRGADAGYEIALPPLDLARRKDAAQSYLQAYRKKLDAPLITALAQDQSCGNPLFLRLLLEELRLHAQYETLAQRIEVLRATRTPGALFPMVLAEMDRDYGDSAHQSPATQAVGFLAASWRGLRYNALAVLLAAATDPRDPHDQRPHLPDRTLAPLLARLSAFVLQDAGRLRLMHAALQPPVADDAALQGARHALIALALGPEPEAVAERLYQFWQLADRKGLLQTLEAPGWAVLAVWRTEPLLLRNVLTWLGAGLDAPEADVTALGAAWGQALLSTARKEGLPKSVYHYGNWLGENAFRRLQLPWMEAIVRCNEEHQVAPEERATGLNNLAGLYKAQGRLAEAEPLYQEALALNRQALRAGHPHIAASLNNLASLYQDQGRLAEAEPLYQEALALNRQALHEGHPTIATRLNNLARLYQDQGRLAEAEPLFQEALAIDRQALRAGHPDIATSLANLAGLYKAQRRLAEAEPLYQEALVLNRQALPEGHPDIATSLNNLARLYQAQRRFAEAEPLYQEALAIDRQAPPEGHPDIATSLNNLAGLYYAQRRLAEAEPLCQEALALRRKTLPEGHLDIATSLHNLARLYQDQRRLAEAEPLFQEALALRRKALRAGHPDIATILNNLARLYQTQGRLAEAEPLFQEALALRRKVLPEGHPDIAKSLNNLARLYQAQGHLAEATPLFAEALGILQKTAPPDDPRLGDLIEVLVGLYETQNQPEKAGALRALLPDEGGAEAAS